MNYPDDINNYRSNPRSPNYDDSQDVADEIRDELVADRAKEIAAEMITPEGFKERGVTWGMTDVTEHIASSDDALEEYHNLLAELVGGSEILTKTLELKTFLLQQAEMVAMDIAEREIP